MLYRAILLFKHGGVYIRPNTIIDLDNENEIEILKRAKAIVDVERKIETAMKQPTETRERKKKGRSKK